MYNLSESELQFSNHLALHPWIDDSLPTLVSQNYMKGSVCKKVFLMCNVVVRVSSVKTCAGFMTWFIF
jgi:hypothetical protein